MDLKKKCRAVMLPTEESSMIATGKVDNLLVTNKINPFDSKLWQNQHLYIVSDDKIEEGDWYINISSDKVYQAGKYNYLTFTSEDHCKKIIATTDKSLIIGVPQFIKGYLPQPSTQFIEKYIKAYNAGNPIMDVMVEYHIDMINEMSSGTTPSDTWVKVDHQNQIVITDSKNSWSREEVIRLLRKFHSDIDEISTKYVTINFDNWINQNL